jgi:HEAT repeat protein
VRRLLFWILDPFIGVPIAVLVILFGYVLIAQPNWTPYPLVHDNPGMDRAIKRYSSVHGVDAAFYNDLHRWRDKAIPAVRRALATTDEDVRLTAITACVVISTKETFSLLEAQVGSGSPRMRVAAINGTGVIGNLDQVAAVRTLQGVVGTASSQEEMDAAIRSLGRIKSEEALTFLSTLLSDHRETVARSACLALIETKDSSVVDEVVSYLERISGQDFVAIAISQLNPNTLGPTQRSRLERLSKQTNGDEHEAPKAAP